MEKKRRNCWVISTDKPSRLHKIGNKLGLTDKPNNNFLAKQQNIYITNDEEIKEGDWYLNNGVIFKADDVFNEGNNPNNSNPRVTDCNKKIILCSDQDLIKDGVQAIDDEFLEWFVKNPNCEEVEVVKDRVFRLDEFNQREFYNQYKIIIPKEESNLDKHLASLPEYPGPRRSAFVNKQETLEEAANKQWGNVHRTGVLGFIEGAKWQTDRMYSEEDMKQFAFECVGKFLSNDDNKVEIKLVDVIIDRLNKHFEQFKKK